MRFLTVCAFRSAARWLALGDSPDTRQLESRSTQIEPHHQSEHIQFDALVTRRGRPDETEQRKLITGPTGRACKKIADREIVLTDGDGRQRQFKLRNFASDVGDKGIAVGAGPDA